MCLVSVECPNDYHYRCPNNNPYVSGANCLNVHTLCDGIYDCVDGADENATFCQATCEDTCEYSLLEPTSRFCQSIKLILLTLTKSRTDVINDS